MSARGSATWGFALSRPRHELVASIYRGHVVVDRIYVGIWRRRLSWLPTWFPCNAYFDVRYEALIEAVQEIHNFCARLNQREVLWPGSTDKYVSPSGGAPCTCP